MEWIGQKMVECWGLISRLELTTSIFLFLIYGLAFEWLYGASLYAYRDFKAYRAANIGTILFLISLYGLNEVLLNNIMYVLPIISGSWIGVVIQVRLAKKKSEKEE